MDEDPEDSPTILFANEFFDAIPVEIVSARGSLRIDANHGKFSEVWVAASPEELEFLDRYSVHPEDTEKLEVPLQSQKLMLAATNMERGFVVAIDYGYTREEQLAGRHRGTLKAIRQHSVSLNPFEAPGDQDMTADVNFTALAAVAQRQGMHTEKLVTQSQFLLGVKRLSLGSKLDFLVPKLCLGTQPSAKLRFESLQPTRRLTVSYNRGEAELRGDAFPSGAWERGTTRELRRFAVA